MYNMAVDTIAISALVVAVLGALGIFIKNIHLRKIACCCGESDCIEERKNKSKSSLTPPETPLEPKPSQETKLTDEQIDQLLKRLTATNEINFIV